MDLDPRMILTRIFSLSPSTRSVALLVGSAASSLTRSQARLACWSNWLTLPGRALREVM